MDLESSETLSRPSQVDGAIKNEIPLKTGDFLENLGLGTSETSEIRRRNGEVRLFTLWTGRVGVAVAGYYQAVAARKVVDAMCE